MVDIRLVVLVTAFVCILFFARARRDWVEPLVTATAVTTIIVTILFFLTGPLLVI